MSDILIQKLTKGLQILENKGVIIDSISVVGGVSNNKYIRNKLESNFSKKNIDVYYPIKEMMGDNAAMIAWACLKFYNKNKNDLFFRPESRLVVKNVL